MSVEIRPIGLASCGTLAWRYRRQLRVTAIVKATFAFVPGGTMTVEPPDDLHRADVPWGARRSLWAASDMVPFRLLADVVLVGHAYLPPGGGVVRLAVLGEKVLVDRRLGVSDDLGDGAPVSLSYERAFGGPGSAENPVGTGNEAGSPLPDVIDVSAPRHPGGFGPLSRSWPARARRLGSTDPAVFAGPIAEIPSDLDWGYFQAAPPGQLTDFLRGDEQIELEGMRREHPVLRTRLPGATAAGRVYGLPTGHAVPIAFRADNLHLDADRMRCSLTWRASFTVPGEEILPELVLLAGIELPGQAISWPEAPGPPAVIEDSQLELVTLPFTAEAPGPHEDPRPAPRQPTMVLEEPITIPSGRQPTMVLEGPGDEHPLLETIPFSADHLPAPMPSPFRLAEPGASRATAAAEIAGAPWASRPAPPVPRPSGAETTRSLVLDPRFDIPDDLLLERPAPPPPPPPPAPARLPPVRPVGREIARPAVHASVRARFPPRPG